MNLDSSKDEQGRFVLSSIIKANGKELSKDKIYEIIKFTIYKNFGSGDKVIQYENKEEGKIYCRSLTREYPYIVPASRKNGGYFTFEITAISKDGKAKVSIGNITHTGGEMTQMRPGSDFGDTFPTAWKKWGDNALGRKVNEQSLDQWTKIKNMAHLDLIAVIALFQGPIQNAKEKKEEF